MFLKGKITEGKKEAQEYLSIEKYQKAFKSKLGFKPYPGTLNIRVDKEKRRKYENITPTYKIKDIYHQGERLSNILISPGKLEGRNIGLLKLEKTEHPPEILEIVSKVKLRKKLKLNTGDQIKIKQSLHKR